MLPGRDKQPYRLTWKARTPISAYQEDIRAQIQIQMCVYICIFQK